MSQALVRHSGRFTVLHQPLSAGNVVFRVFFPACTRFRQALTNRFSIRGY
ncbi:hypothetical protein [Kribbella steppae]|nr:hypothetical protein [Kribbella steppae]